MEDHRQFLREMFDTAVSAAQAETRLPPHLPEPPKKGRVIILAAGKAAAMMTAVAERHYLKLVSKDRISGLGVTRHGYSVPTQVVPIMEAGHPIPDDAGLKAAGRVLEIAHNATKNDLVLILLSGGSSANWIAPIDGITFTEKASVNRSLLRSGASIGEVLMVRKHLSKIKGGRLAVAAYPAKIVTLAFSDIPQDDPELLGSGPTVPDPTTLAQARAVIEQYGLDLPDAVLTALSDEANETPKLGNPAFNNTTFKLLARPVDSLNAVEKLVRQRGYECVKLRSDIEGEARTVAEAHAKIALDMARDKRRVVIISGGELTATVRGNGRGGPNQEYALGLAIALRGAPGISAVAANTDGADGGAGSPADPAGAFIDESTLSRAASKGLAPEEYLNNNDTANFFAALDDLLITGPTFTNVNDFRAILIDAP